MAERIIRRINIKSDYVIEPIHIVFGTNDIAISLAVNDMDISSYTAIARNLNGGKRFESQALVEENAVVFTPQGGFFLKGHNKLQIELKKDEKYVYAFTVPVICEENIMESGTLEEAQTAHAFAEQAAQAAKESADSAGAAAKSQQAAAGSAESAGASAEAAGKSAQAAQESETAAEKAKEEASGSARAAKASEDAAAGSASEAAGSASAAEKSETAAAGSAGEAAKSATEAAGSAQAAGTSEKNAKASQDAAAGSAAAAKASENAAKESQTAAAGSASTAEAAKKAAAGSATAAENWAKLSESYAHGKTGEREGEDEDNAKKYAERAEAAAKEAESIAGGNVVLKSDIGKPGGVAGLGEDGKVPETQIPESVGKVKGVRGNAEEGYQEGLVEISPTKLKLDNFAVALQRANVQENDTLDVAFGKLAKYCADLKAVAFSGKYSDLSGIEDLAEQTAAADTDNLLIGTDGAKRITFASLVSSFIKKLTGGASSILTSNMTSGRVLVSDNNGKVAVSSITSTILGYLANLTGNIQDQLNAKLAKANLANNATTTEEGYALDARMGKAIQDQVDELNSKITVHSDTDTYYAESIQYNSGRMIINMRCVYTIEANSVWGNMYYGLIDPPDFPIPFVSIPTMIATIGNSQSDFILIKTGNSNKFLTKTSPGRFSALRTSKVTGTATVHIHAEGYWK